jgi:hypothetical protein
LYKIPFLFLYTTFLFSNTDIYIDISQDTIFVGDKIQVTIIAQTDGLHGIEFPKLDVDNKDISLSTISTGDTSLVLALQFWQPGNHKFPSVQIHSFKQDSTLDVFNTDPLEFRVLERIDVLENSPRDSKINKKISLPLTFKHFFLSLIIFLTLIALYVFINKRERPNLSLNSSRNINFFNDTIIKLEQLRLPKEVGSKELEAFYISLSKILKDYISVKFFFNGTKMTTDEISKYLISNNIPSAELKDLLEEADLCKFAQKKCGVTTLVKAKKNAKSIVNNFEGLSI